MIIEKLKKLIAEQFSVEEEEISEETNFVDDLGADSVDIVELIMSVEQEFDLPEVEENALENIKTVGDVADYIAEQQK